MKVMIDDGAFMPERAHEDDAGYDLRTPVPFTIAPYTPYKGAGKALINTGVHIALDKGTVGFLKSKSGLNVNSHIVGEGVIDCGFTGSIKVKLYNFGNEEKHFDAGDKIIQLVVLPINTPVLEPVETLDDTERGDNGFGSTGK